MNKKEVIKFLKLISAEYNYFLRDLDEETYNLKIQLWKTMLTELDLNTAIICFQKHLCSDYGNFAPSISSILKYYSQLKFGIAKDACQAWGEVISVINKYGYYNQEKALKSLDIITREVVEYIGFKEMCLSNNTDLLRSQFKNFYNTIVNRKNQYNSMPNILRQLQEKSDMNLLQNEDNKKIEFKNEKMNKNDFCNKLESVKIILNKFKQ